MTPTDSDLVLAFFGEVPEPPPYVAVTLDDGAIDITDARITDADCAAIVAWVEGVTP